MKETIDVSFVSGDKAQIVIESDYEHHAVVIHYPQAGKAALSPDHAESVAKQFSIPEAAEAARRVADDVRKHRDIAETAES